MVSNTNCKIMSGITVVCTCVGWWIHSLHIFFRCFDVSNSSWTLHWCTKRNPACCWRLQDYLYPHLIVFTLSLDSKNLVSSAQAFTSLPAPTGSFPLLRYASTATLSTFGSFRCNMYYNKLFPLSGTVQGQGPVQVTAFNTGWSGCYQMHFWFQSAFLTFTYQFL